MQINCLDHTRLRGYSSAPLRLKPQTLVTQPTSVKPPLLPSMVPHTSLTIRDVCGTIDGRSGGLTDVGWVTRVWGLKRSGAEEYPLIRV